jgi:hypothetical protein
MPHRIEAPDAKRVRKCRNDGSAGGLYDHPMTLIPFS